jgi:hypothetical protein
MITRKGVALVVGAVALLVAGCSSAEVAATVDGVEIAESAVLGIRVANEGEVSVPGDQFRSDLSRLIFTQALLVAAEADFGFTGLDTPETREAYLASIDPREQEFLDSIATDTSLTDEALKVTVTQLVLMTKVREELPDDWTIWIDEAVEQAEITVRSDIGTWFSAADGIAPPPRSP